MQLLGKINGEYLSENNCEYLNKISGERINKIRGAYFDCTLGISGNMIIGAFIDLGLPIEVLRREVNKVLQEDSYKLIVKKLPVPSGKITYFNTEEASLCNNGQAGDKVSVVNSVANKENPSLVIHKSINALEVIRFLEESSLEEKIKGMTLKIFRLLAEAKGEAHGCPLKEVNFSSEGITDTLIDIIGSVVAIDYYNIQRLLFSPLNLGHGKIILPHREIDIPAPMTRILLKDKPCFSNGMAGERVTPTGAAIVSALAEEFILPKDINYKKIGYGAATEDSDINGVLKIML